MALGVFQELEGEMRVVTIAGEENPCFWIDSVDPEK
jgi:hypothetical protein